MGFFPLIKIKIPPIPKPRATIRIGFNNSATLWIYLFLFLCRTAILFKLFEDIFAILIPPFNLFYSTPESVLINILLAYNFICTFIELFLPSVLVLAYRSFSWYKFLDGFETVLRVYSSWYIYFTLLYFVVSMFIFILFQMNDPAVYRRVIHSQVKLLQYKK